METNKLNSLFYRILEKTSFEYLDLDQNNQVSHEEILYYAYKDEELRAELEDADLEMIKDYISFTDNKSSENQASETEDTSTLNSINTALSKLNSSEMQLLTLLFSMLLKSTSLNTSDLTTLLTKLLSETNSLNKDKNETKADDSKQNTKNNINYESLKSVYQQYLENSSIVDENSKDGKYSATTSQQLDINEKPIEVPLSTAYWNGEKEKDRWDNINVRKLVDVNGDSKVSFEDLSLIPEEVDLDGDGEISTAEKSFLKKLKVRLYLSLKNNIVSSINKKNCEIDDIIQYLDITENDKYISQVTKGAEIYIKKQGSGGKQFVNEDSSVWSFTGISATSFGTPSTVVSKYLNVIIKSDLSKEQLTKILNKINAASSSVQSQLSEVKKAVEEKLANL